MDSAFWNLIQFLHFSISKFVHVEKSSSFLVDTFKIWIVGFTFRENSIQRVTLKSTYANKSILLIIIKFAAWNISEYFNGLLSPSVTERTTNLCASPKSNDDGQTKSPAFSTAKKLFYSTPSFCTAWTIQTPAARILSVSCSVCWLPWITAIGNLSFKTLIVSTNKVVFQAPGLETRFKTKILFVWTICTIFFAV